MKTTEFLDRMSEIAKNGDQEAAHADADDLMCELLESLGYGDGVDVFRAMDKWYA